MSIRGNLSHEDFSLLARCTGGMALLLFAAVFLSNSSASNFLAANISPQSLAASYCITQLGPCSGAPGSPIIQNFSISQPFVYGGQPTLSWNVTGIGGSCYIAGGQFGNGYPCTVNGTGPWMCNPSSQGGELNGNP